MLIRVFPDLATVVFDQCVNLEAPPVTGDEDSMTVGMQVIGHEHQMGFKK